MAQKSLEEANSPAAIRAALAKFPVSMQAINSLLSSTVFLRTRAGFPFPHFGRLRVVLKGGREESPDLLLIGWIQSLPESSNSDHLSKLNHNNSQSLSEYLVLPCRLQLEEMEDSEAQRLRGSTACPALLGLSGSAFSSSPPRNPLDRPERRHGTKNKHRKEKKKGP